MDAEKKVFLSVQKICKSFGPTKALTDVSIDFEGGQIHGLIGENGSGKSTLSSIITGALKEYSGKIYYRGKEYVPESIAVSKEQGICIMAQELGTIDGLSVAANIFLGREDAFSLKGTARPSKLKVHAAEILKKVGAEAIDPGDKVEVYSFEQRKLIEVAAAMYWDPSVLIVDETTSALSLEGRRVLYRMMHKMREAGKLVIFISHELEELKEQCDKISVLKDGHMEGTLTGEEITEENMRALMVGRALQGNYYREDEAEDFQQDVVISVKDLSCGSVLSHVSFELHRGEIPGIGGLSECGMHELLKIIFGTLRGDEGEVRSGVSGRLIRRPKDALKEKIAYLAKDRDKESIFLNTSIRENIVMMALDRLRKGPYISDKKERELALENARLLKIKMQNINQLVKELSGGNKQKAAVAKWLANQSEIYLMDCPTRGIDIGVKQSIYQLMGQLKREGKSILMVSEELPELIGMSDRILVMKDGKIKAEFLRSQRVDEQMMIKEMI